MTDLNPHPTTGMPIVKGRCPACRRASLFLGAGGYVTCGHLECPQPGAATELLEKPECANVGAGFFGPLGPCVLRHGHADPEHQDAKGTRWSLLRESPQTAADARPSEPARRRQAPAREPNSPPVDSSYPDDTNGPQASTQSLGPEGAARVAGFDQYDDYRAECGPECAEQHTYALGCEMAPAPSGDAPVPSPERHCQHLPVHRAHPWVRGLQPWWCPGGEPPRKEAAPISGSSGWTPAQPFGGDAADEAPEEHGTCSACGEPATRTGGAWSHNLRNGCGEDEPVVAEFVPAPPAGALRDQVAKALVALLIKKGYDPEDVDLDHGIYDRETGEVVDAVLPVVQAELDRRAAHAGHGSPCENSPDGSCARPASAGALRDQIAEAIHATSVCEVGDPVRCGGGCRGAAAAALPVIEQHTAQYRTLRARVRAVADEARGSVRDWLIYALADDPDVVPSTAQRAEAAEAELRRVSALHADTERQLRAHLADEVQKREAADARLASVRDLAADLRGITGARHIANALDKILNPNKEG